MDKYYYLIAQLPTLAFGKEPGITIERFLDEAEKWMDDGDYRILQTVDSSNVAISKQDPGDLKSYKQFEFALRSDIAAWREAQAKDVDYKPASFPVSMIKEGNPLDVELKFMDMRWQLLDEIEREHHFDFTYVIIYFLKLQLLHRYFTFDKEQGLNKFQKLYQEVTA
ncbi:DUF2764 family protein [candidate division KSB1 bacterium]|nr:DUF2764 family protein [candidate division KSB1 bacterium]